jgi:murein DD-endopeptidase MepM/ murein hydrolase activator NlpD
MDHVEVRVGQKVNRGDILGVMGRSGNATGVHLHYEVRIDGKPVNPTPYLKLQRQWLSALGKQS